MSPVSPGTLRSDCGGGSSCGGLGFGALCALVGCGMAMQSACEKKEPVEQENTGCGA